MKKHLLGLLAGILILGTVTSCQPETSADTADSAASPQISETAPPQPSYDRFVYRLENTVLDWLNIGMPLKVSLTSGKTTAVCIDPLCMHDSEDCPFFDCTGAVIDGEILFFRRGWMSRGENGYTGTEKLCTYHVATGKMHILEEYTDSLVFLDVFDDVLYYYTAEWEKAGDTLACTYHLHRADGKTGKVTELTLPETYRTVGGFTNNSDYPNILMMDGETMYWYKYNEDRTASFYTSDPDAGNWQKIEESVKTFANLYHGGYGYSVGAVLEMKDPDGGRTKDNVESTYYLVRRKAGEADQERIAENIGSSNFIVTDRYIFTMESLTEAPDDLTLKKEQYSYGSSVVLGSRNTEAVILNGCRIWRMNHDGSDRVMIAETDGYYFAQEQQYRHDEILFGYYEDEENTYLAFFFMEQDENGDLILSRDTLILNTETGEFSVSEWIV